MIKAVADGDCYVRRTFPSCLQKMPVHGGSIPYSETVGLEAHLLGLAHGSTTSAALSTESALGPFSKGCGDKAMDVACNNWLSVYVLG